MEFVKCNEIIEFTFILSYYSARIFAFFLFWAVYELSHVLNRRMRSSIFPTVLLLKRPDINTTIPEWSSDIHSPTRYICSAAQYIKAHRHGQDHLLKLRPSIRILKKGDFRDFEFSRVVDARQARLSIQENADLLGFPCTTISI